MNIIITVIVYGIVMALIYGGFLGRQAMSIIIPVSYTHLDVYKRQTWMYMSYY